MKWVLTNIYLSYSLWSSQSYSPLILRCVARFNGQEMRVSVISVILYSTIVHDDLSLGSWVTVLWDFLSSDKQVDNGWVVSV